MFKRDGNWGTRMIYERQFVFNLIILPASQNNYYTIYSYLLSVNTYNYNQVYFTILLYLILYQHGSV